MSKTIPSVKTLMRLPQAGGGRARTNIDASTANAIRDVLKSNRRVDKQIEMVDQIVEGHGIEAVGDDFSYTDEGLRHCPMFTYVNMGDTYIQTLIRDHGNERWVVADLEWMANQVESRGRRERQGNPKVGKLISELPKTDKRYTIRPEFVGQSPIPQYVVRLAGKSGLSEWIGQAEEREEAVKIAQHHKRTGEKGPMPVSTPRPAPINSRYDETAHYRGNPVARKRATKPKQRSEYAASFEQEGKLSPTTVSSIEYIMRNVNVAESEDYVIDMFQKRLKKMGEAGTPYGDAIIEAALDAHWHNMREYVSIMNNRTLPMVRPSRSQSSQSRRAHVPPTEEMVTRAMGGDPVARAAILGEGGGRKGNPVRAGRGRLQNPVYDAYSPNPIKLPLKLLQPHVRLKRDSSIVVSKRNR